MTLTITKSGAHVVTVEGIGTSKAPHPAQVRAFLQHSYSIPIALLQHFYSTPQHSSAHPFLLFLLLVFSLPSALFFLLSAILSLLYFLRSVLSALSSLLSALCYLLCFLCFIISAL
jgi:hypothetical protein